nr:hypothetical transcript [Hymenolepis microstoma]
MSIKSKIQRFEGIPICQQHLIWQNGELSDHQSLQDYSIPGGATLHLRWPPLQPNSNDDLPPSTTTTSIPSLNENEVRDREDEKQITFYFVNSADHLDFMRAVNKHHHRETASTNSLLRSEASSEYPLKAPFLPSNLSNSKTTQSLPFLQSEESSLSCCDDPQKPKSQLATTASEPSVLKASTERQKSSSPTAIAAATSLFTGYAYGRDSSYASDTEDCLLPECNGNTTAAAYFLQPSSPEWDNQDLSTTPPMTVPPFFPSENREGEEYTVEEDNDSLADLKDCLLCYQSGDLLFGPRRNGSYSNNWRGNFITDADGPILTRSKAEECESLAEKMRYIKHQLSHQRQERIKRRLRHQQQQGNEENGCESNKEIKKPSAAPESGLSSFTNQGSSHVPKIRYRGDQSFRTVHPSRRNFVQATVSAVDLSSTEPSNTSAAPSIDNITTLLQSSSRRRFLEPSDCYFYLHQNHNHHQPQKYHHGERFRREAAPNKTTSETDLDAAAIIPGFSGYADFSHHNQRHRRFGTVQPPDFSRLGVSSSGGGIFDRLRSLLNLEDDEVVEDSIDSASGSSSLPQIFPPLIPSAATTSVATSTATMNASSIHLLRGHSPTMKKAHSSEATLSAFSNNMSSIEEQTRSVEGTLKTSTQAKDDLVKSSPPQTPSKKAPSPPGSPSKTRKDVPSESPRRSPTRLKVKRCASCNRKTGLANFYTCRCERNFCAKHRYAELHDCPFDYKTEARRVIQETNPVVTAAKLPKI